MSESERVCLVSCVRAWWTCSKCLVGPHSSYCCIIEQLHRRFQETGATATLIHIQGDDSSEGHERHPHQTPNNSERHWMEAEHPHTNITRSDKTISQTYSESPWHKRSITWWLHQQEMKGVISKYGLTGATAWSGFVEQIFMSQVILQMHLQIALTHGGSSHQSACLIQKYKNSSQCWRMMAHWCLIQCQCVLMLNICFFDSCLLVRFKALRTKPVSV